MEIFRSVEEYMRWKCGSGAYAGGSGASVALGNFDGVHIGHTEIIRSAVKAAEETGALPVCYTFSNHPRNMRVDMASGEEPVVKLIAAEEDKLRLIEALGIKVCLSVPFDETVMNTPAEDFIRNVLYSALDAKTVCCGFNYRFGARAAGDVSLLKSEGAKYGIEIMAHEPVTVDGLVVSSTAIRELIAKGDMEKCGEYLGRPYSLSGRVVYGNKIGHKMGFPTANLDAGNRMALPPNGVYYSDIIVYDGTGSDAGSDGRGSESARYHGVTNVGNKPTVGTYSKSIETNLFEFSGDLYGKFIRVELLHHSRPETRFRDLNELESQISQDVKDARAYHGLK